MDHLADNLSRMAQDARLRDALASCRSERVRVDAGGDGVPVLRIDGVAHHSARDPAAEAEALLARAKLDGIDHVLLFGIGGGHLLEALARRTEAELLVYEPDLEVLAGCLSARRIAVERAVLLRDKLAVRSYLRDTTKPRGRVLLLAWPPTVRRHAADLAEVKEYVGEAMIASAVGENTWNSRLSAWIENILTNLPAALRHPPLGAVEGALAGRPAFLVAAGPSLERNLGLLRGLDGRGLVLTVNTAVPALDRHGVRPDVVATIESVDVSRHLAGSAGFEGARFVVDLTAHPSLFRLRPRLVLPFTDMIGYYAVWLRDLGAATPLNSGCCAAHAAFSTARLLGCDPIVLVGQDAALTGGEFYAKSTAFGGMRLSSVAGDEGRIEGDESKVELHRDQAIGYGKGKPIAVHPVERWGGGGTVLSTPQLDYVRMWYAETAQGLEGARLINATEGGARIAGFEEARLSDVLAALPPGAVDAREIDARAAPTDRARIETVLAGLDAMRDALDEVARTARRAMVARPGREEAAAERLRKVSTDILLLSGYARRELAKVVEGGGTLRELCAVIIQRTMPLSARVEMARGEIAALRDAA